MKLLLPCLCFLSMSLHAANWHPEYVLAENKVPDNKQIAELEQKIIDYTKNSWCSPEKAKLIFELIVEVKPSICVEIGAFTGSSTVPMLAGLQYLNKGYAYIIDAWDNKEAVQGLPSEDPNTIWWQGLDMKAIEAHFTNSMKYWSFKPFFSKIPLPSKKAISKIPAINFLHLDGNLSEEGALLDCQMYLPKVVSGGHVLLSNALIMINGKATKAQAIHSLFSQCKLVCELENGNTLLFKKH